MNYSSTKIIVTVYIAAIKLNSYLLHLTKTNVFGYIRPRQVIICTKLKNKNQFHNTSIFLNIN